MKITTSGMTVELSDSFTGEVVVNGVSFKVTPSQFTQSVPVQDNSIHNVRFSHHSSCEKINFMKFLRHEFNLGLREAKELSERGQYGCSRGGAVQISCVGSAQRDRVINAIKECNYILC